jgi:hypothetical protein
VSDRDVRQFGVYRDGRLALMIRDNPGTLRSTAGPPAPGTGPPPPPPGPPPPEGEPFVPPPAPGSHPFIDAQAYNPISEDRLRKLLDDSASFDDYLRRLLDAGFDIASVRPDEGYDYELPDGMRLYDDGTLAGACWPAPGQFTTLDHQPAEDELGFDVATATAYRPAWGEPMLQALRGARSFGDLIDRLEASGLAARR